MMYANNLIFLSTIIALGFLIRIVFSRKISPEANKATSFIWFQEMDCIKNGARYQGERSKIVVDNGYEKLYIGCYAFYYSCETKSGRTFFIKITTNMGLVTNWDIVPVERSEVFGEETQKI